MYSLMGHALHVKLKSSQVLASLPLISVHKGECGGWDWTGISGVAGAHGRNEEGGLIADVEIDYLLPSDIGTTTW